MARIRYLNIFGSFSFCILVTRVSQIDALYRGENPRKVAEWHFIVSVLSDNFAKCFKLSIKHGRWQVSMQKGIEGLLVHMEVGHEWKSVGMSVVRVNGRRREKKSVGAAPRGLGAGAWLHALCREEDHVRASQQGVWLGEGPEEVRGKGHAGLHANRPGLLGPAGWAVPCSLGQKLA